MGRNKLGFHCKFTLESKCFNPLIKWKSRIFISFIHSYLVGRKLELGQKCSKVCIFEHISSGLLTLYAPSDLVIVFFTSHMIITYEDGQNHEKDYRLQFLLKTENTCILDVLNCIISYLKVYTKARALENILYVISYLDYIVISSLISW